jgi:5S rRNA maturation endonuclease (ribonuclease M5)
MYAGTPNSPDAAICARIESDKCVGTKGAGWLHRLRDDNQWQSWGRYERRLKIDAPDPVIDFGIATEECEAALGPLGRKRLADELGVSDQSLHRLRVGWSHKYRSYTFPMTDAAGRVRGIRLRGMIGHKWAVTGSRDGLFIPRNVLVSLPFDGGGGMLLVCEGATDCAALTDLGFAAVGRPSCNGGTSQILSLIQKGANNRPREVVIVADDDAPGLRGAQTLAAAVVAYVKSVRTITPPKGVKDARKWKQRGASRKDVLAVIEDAPALKLHYRVRTEMK